MMQAISKKPMIIKMSIVEQSHCLEKTSERNRNKKKIKAKYETQAWTGEVQHDQPAETANHHDHTSGEGEKNDCCYKITHENHPRLSIHRAAIAVARIAPVSATPPLPKRVYTSKKMPGRAITTPAIKPTLFIC